MLVLPDSCGIITMIIEIRAGFVSRASCSTNRYWLSSRFCLSCHCNITCVVAN